MALPIMCQPIVSSDVHGQGGGEVYVDGGLLCNYPLHVFDGWWLSMKPEDTFTRRLCGNLADTSFAIKTRFAAVNRSSIGFRLESKAGTGEKITQLMSADEIAHFTVLDMPLPNTKLARHFQTQRAKQVGREPQATANGSMVEHVEEAVEALFAWFHKNEDKSASGQFRLEDLHELLESDPPDIEPEMFGYESIFEQVHHLIYSMQRTRTRAQLLCVYFFGEAPPALRIEACACPLLRLNVHVTICMPHCNVTAN